MKVSELIKALSEPTESNYSEKLNSSDHFPDPTKMVAEPKNEDSASAQPESVEESRIADDTANWDKAPLAQDPDKMVDNIIEDGFRAHNRLHIAAMAMQGILSNYNPELLKRR